ncbi:MAG TPA: type II secretion system F family protein [Patescibacteria group bacterium]|nr:type II secretion system F family protein [Patescibacteria group bacterium]
MSSLSSVSLSDSEKISFLSNLCTMLTAGIPILDAIDSIAEDTKGHQRKILDTIRRDLQQGKRLSTTFALFPRAFDKVTVNLVKAAEEAGTLETTLKDLRDHVQKEVEFSDKVKFAMIYPSLIMIVFFLVLFSILIFVVPKISSVFSRLRMELPLPTRIMVWASDIIVHQTWYLVGGTAAIVALMFLIYKTNRSLFINFFFSWPLISGLVRQIDLARFSRGMHLLLSSGVPITSALELCQDVVIKKQSVLLISKSREMVAAGKRLSEGFRSSKVKIPSILIKLVEAGEKSGTLDKSMQDISIYLDYQVTNALKTLTAVMEPVMLVIVGISVGAMMLAIIGPIYGLIGKVGVR